jgi:hypothetical protein
MSKIKQVAKTLLLHIVVSLDKDKEEERHRILSSMNPFLETLHPSLIWVEREKDK